MTTVITTLGVVVVLLLLGFLSFAWRILYFDAELDRKWWIVEGLLVLAAAGFIFSLCWWGIQASG